jgi:hypothetical protein
MIAFFITLSAALHIWKEILSSIVNLTVKMQHDSTDYNRKNEGIYNREKKLNSL